MSDLLKQFSFDIPESNEDNKPAEYTKPVTYQATNTADKTITKEDIQESLSISEDIDAVDSL